MSNLITNNKLPNIQEHLSPRINSNLSLNKLKLPGINSIPIKNSSLKEIQSVNNYNVFKGQPNSLSIINPPNIIANPLKYYSSNLSNLQKKIAAPQIKNIKFFSSKKIKHVNISSLSRNCSLPSTKNNSRKTSTRTSDDSFYIEISNESLGH
jgi:hypothetical protein